MGATIPPGTSMSETESQIFSNIQAYTVSKQASTKSVNEPHAHSNISPAPIIISTTRKQFANLSYATSSMKTFLPSGNISSSIKMTLLNEKILYLIFILLAPTLADPQRSFASNQSDVDKVIAWLPAILPQFLANFVPAGRDLYQPCTKDGQTYRKNLENLTYWATQMLDASSLGSSPGLLAGRNTDYGHFDTCVSALSPDKRIRGKYLVAELEFEPSSELYPAFRRGSPIYTIPESSDSAWEAVRPVEDRRISPRNRLRFSLCVPQTCSESDIQRSLSTDLRQFLKSHRILSNLTVLSAYSYSRPTSQSESSTSQYIFMFFVMILAVLILVSTAYDLSIHEAEQDKSWYMNFSMKRNINDLLKTPKNEFAVMSGMKVISMITIIYGHRMMISVSTPQFNPNNVQLATGHYFATMVDNGTLIVNTFMTITGFLTFYKITQDIYNGREIKVFKNICNRFLRLTPAYLFVMAFQYFIFPEVEGGPQSRSVVWDPQTFGTYWWTHLLYINNYVKPAFQCLVPSWYMALDMQMFILAQLFGWMVAGRWKRYTSYFLVSLSALALAFPAIPVFKHGYSGTYRIYYTSIMDYFRDPEFQDMYMPTHIRCAPYIIGMLGGYVYHHMKVKNYSFQNKTLWSFTLMSVALLHMSLFWAYPFYIPVREYVLWENVAYATLHRLAWALPIVWVVIASSIGNFRPLKFLLGVQGYEFFNKLNYSALLVHTLVQIYMIGFIRSPVNYGRIVGLWMAGGDVIFTYAVSILLYCMVEAPFSQLQKKIWDLTLLNNEDSKIFQKKS